MDVFVTYTKNYKYMTLVLVAFVFVTCRTLKSKVNAPAEALDTTNTDTTISLDTINVDMANSGGSFTGALKTGNRWKYWRAYVHAGLYTEYEIIDIHIDSSINDSLCAYSIVSAASSVCDIDTIHFYESAGVINTRNPPVSGVFSYLNADGMIYSESSSYSEIDDKMLYQPGYGTYIVYSYDYGMIYSYSKGGIAGCFETYLMEFTSSSGARCSFAPDLPRANEDCE
jgi:hypothetical protein